MTAAVDTSKVTDRRTLRFASPADLDADLARLVAAERAGTLRTTGNWTFGQILGHLSSWINYAYDGYPPELRPAWWVKILCRMAKKKFLFKPLPPGFRIPNAPSAGTFGTDPLPNDIGLNKFNASWSRLRKAPPAAPNIIFGPLSHEEWIQLHLRHAELHLGYVHPS